MFVDSHCHLHFIDYEKLKLSEAEVIENAKLNKVEHILCVATNFNQSKILTSIKEKYKNFVSISLGLHPSEKIEKEITTQNILELTNDIKIVGIGETGLDYYWNKNDLVLQKQRFVAHINAAKELKKPLIIHCRDAKNDLLTILKKERASSVGGVVHCFTEDLDLARSCIDLGFYISFSGIISFKNAKLLQTVVKNIPLDNILIETDSPYLSPAPMRGKINQPAYVCHVAKAIAELKEIAIEQIAKVTTKNFYDLFGM